MKKIFTDKKIWQKIVIILVLIILFEFMVSSYHVEGLVIEDVGGKLMSSVMDLVVGIGDLGTNIVQYAVLGTADGAFIPVDRGVGWLQWLAAAGAFIGAAVGLVATGILTGGAALVVAAAAGAASWFAVGGIAEAFDSTQLPVGWLMLPAISISPREIFANEVYMLDVNFFEPRKAVAGVDQYATDSNGDPVPSIATELRDNIATWYVALRNIAIVGLLSILIYVGIRMMLTSLASEKAKYRQLMMDWLVALCMVFVLHYIMNFSVIIVEKVTEGISSIGYEGVEEFVLKDDKTYDTLEKMDKEKGTKYKENGIIYEDGGKKTVKWVAGNFLSQARLKYQMRAGENEDSFTNLSYGIIYFVLVVFTIYFLFVYIKRLVYLAFLTMIAPLVALTYPLDKMGDGKAQAFDTWLKEYLFNLLIQPMHLVLYTVLIASAMKLASANPLYVIVALGFMLPAEKLLRRFFGFEKAQTPGGLMGAAVGANAIMSGVNAIKSLGAGAGKGRSNTSAKDDNSGDKVRNDKKFNNPFDATATLAEGVPEPEGGASTQPETEAGNRTRPTIAGENPDSLNDGQNEAEYWSRIADDNQRQAELDEYDAYQRQFPPETYDSDGLDDQGYWDQLAASADGYEADRAQRQSDLDNYERARREAELEDQARQRRQAIQEQQAQQTQPITPIRQADIPSEASASQVDTPTPTRLTGNRSDLTKAERKAKRKEGRKAVRRVIAPKVGRAAIRGATTLAKVGAGVTLGTAAGAATLITGDPGKVAAAAAAGMGAGQVLTSGAIRTADAASERIASNAREIRDAYYGNDEEYRQKQEDKKVKKMMKDAELNTYLSQKFGEQELDQMKESGELDYYLRHDITDKKEIGAAHKLTTLSEQEGGVNGDYKKATAVAKYSNRIGENTNDMSEKKKDEWRKTFDNEFGEKPGVNGQAHAREITKGTFKKLDVFNAEKYK